MLRTSSPLHGRPAFGARRRPHWAGVTAVLLLHVAVMLALLSSTRIPATSIPERMTVSVSLAPPTLPRVGHTAPANPRSTAKVVKPSVERRPSAVSEVAPLASAEPAAQPTTVTDSRSAAVLTPAPPPVVAASAPAPVVPPRADAAHLNNPVPAYPSASRRFGEQGRVLLDVFILADGSVGEIRLKRTSGFARLDEAALDAVRRWRFVPARHGDQPIALWHVQPITFSLDT